MISFKLKKDKWKFYYSRPYKVFTADLQYFGYDKYAEQEYRFKTLPYRSVLIDNNFFIPSKLFDELINKFKNKIEKDKSALENYYNLTEKRCLSLIKEIKRLVDNRKLSRFNRFQLIKLWDKVLDELFLGMPYFWIPWIIVDNNLIVDQLINEINKKVNNKERTRRLVSELLRVGVRDDYLSAEIKFLIKLSNKIGKFLGRRKPTSSNIKDATTKNPELKKEFNSHVKKFSFINTLSFEFRPPYKNNYYLKRIKENIEDDNLDISKMKVSCYEKKLSEKAKFLLNWSREYAYILNISMEQLYKAVYLARPLFAEVAKRLGIALDELSYLLIKEVTQALNEGELDKKLKNKIKERKLGYIYYFVNHKSDVLTGEDYKKVKTEILDNIKKVDKKERETRKTIKGMIGNKGYVKGRVSVILDENKISRVKRGDILVCSMTCPTYVPAIEKAAAIITDEGGLLCHAAVISREFNKPCIIATKIATQVLKDGDFVEVDANKGIIKIIKK